MYILRTSWTSHVLTALSVGVLASCASSSTRTPVAPPAPTASSPLPLATPFWHSPSVVQERCASDLREGRRLQDAALTASGTLGALNAYNDLLLLLTDLSHQVTLILQVHPDDSVREAAARCAQQLRTLRDRMIGDGVVYEALASINPSQLRPDARRFLQKEMASFRLKGVALPAKARSKARSIEQQLREVKQEFLHNIQKDTRYIQVHPQQLKGLPTSFLDQHQPGEDGLIRLSTEYTDYLPVLTYAQDDSVRRSLAEAFYARGYPRNTSVLTELLSLRYQYAQLLGFANWADYVAQDKMVGSAQAILTFTERMNRYTQPRLQKDLNTLLKLKRMDDPTAQEIFAWDLRFYLERQHQGRRQDLAKAREYFQTEMVVNGSLNIFAKLFGISITQESDAIVWHPSVQRYKIEKNGKLIGRFYLDIYRRSDKYPGTAMFPVHTGIERGQLPEASLVSSFSLPPKGDGLMSHQEVTALFHEFGLLFHHIFARSSRWSSLTGASVEWDFILAPALVFAEWAWEPAVLRQFARHHTTGETIPAPLIERIRNSRPVGMGIETMQQIFYQALSLRLHTTEPNIIDLEAITREVEARYSPWVPLKGAHMYANFHQLGTYGTLLYTQQWSLARARDILTRFTTPRPLNAEVAQMFAKTILAPGGTEPAHRLIERFLGRRTNEEALRAWLNTPPRR